MSVPKSRTVSSAIGGAPALAVLATAVPTANAIRPAEEGGKSSLR